MNDRKQVLFNPCYFTTIPGVRLAGRTTRENENKANLVQIQLKLPDWTELGNLKEV